MNDISLGFPFSRRLVDDETASMLECRLDTIIHALQHDYFPLMSNDEFFRQCVFHESLVMKQAAFRFLSTDIADLLLSRVAAILESISERSSSDRLFFHPVFYTRLSVPNEFKGSSEIAFFDSQPHYDRSFNVYARSCWLALKDVCYQTGGICFFNESSEVSSDFYVSWGEKNRYNYDLYVANHRRLDAFLVPQVIHPTLKAGEAYFFDSNVLHAATKPITKSRMSFDFRVYDDSVLHDCDLRTKMLFNVVAHDLEISNAMNLLTFGDLNGALFIYPDLEDFLGISGRDALDLFSRYSSTVPGQKVSWRDEYSFLDSPLFQNRYQKKKAALHSLRF